MTSPCVDVAELIRERDSLRAALLQTVLAVKDTALVAVLREEAERKASEERKRLLAENEKLRAELDALRAAPSEAEIEAWRQKARQLWVGPVWDKNADEAVALMRRAQRPAPAASGALREAAENAIEHYESLSKRTVTEMPFNFLHAMDSVRAALAAEPPAPRTEPEPASASDGLQRLLQQMNLGFAEDTRNIDHLGDKVEGVWFVVRELARRAGAK